MLPIIGVVVGALAEIGKSWLENRRAKADGKIEITKAKIATAVAKEKMKSTMDLSAMDGMQFSWKDEYLLILLSLPVIMAFIPGLVPYALAGFNTIAMMPAWYQWALTGMVAATFGLRTWKGFGK